MTPDELLLQHPSKLLTTPEGRRIATRYDPALFAVIYTPHHLKDPATDTITFARAHDDWYALMKTLVVPVTAPRQWRHALVAPRECGKSTTWFLVAPLWAAAHNHSRFAAAFADTATQAETHLATFRHELANNDLLRLDFPDLTTPGPSDTKQMLHTKSGFVFAARGADTSSLGLKVGAARPDLIILDDIEPGEANYSAFQAEKRLSTLLEVILPLNERARVLTVGTVTMPNSIIHQLVLGEEPWVQDENFKVLHHLALDTDPDTGDPRSIWPEKWSTEFLQSISHTRAFQKNYQNSPVGSDGLYWSPADIPYADLPEAAKLRTIISIDPAVTSRTTSDNTGIAVLSFHDGKIYVRHAEGIKQGGRGLRQHVERLLQRFPETRIVLIETNQGGEVWREVFSGIPVRLRETFSSDPKHVRAAELLEHYQRARVVHVNGMFDRTLTEELLNFPKAPHDDILDAVAIGARYFAPLTRPRFNFAVA